MFKVAIQTLISPWISAILFIYIFGEVVGKNILPIEGVPYIEFVLPGILMMNVITSAFSHASSSLYFHRFMRRIEEMLVAPLSHTEMILGYVIGGVTRGIIVGVGVLLVGLFFDATTILHPFLFLFYIILVSVVFSLIGILTGLWAQGFEQFSMITVFVITPLSFLGGVFNSVSMLPEKMQTFVMFNPFFYFIDGIRYAMVGIGESNLYFGVFFILGLIVILWALVAYLFHIGWRLRT
jgi:ABC-2 type transport system permease protein